MFKSVWLKGSKARPSPAGYVAGLPETAA